MAGGIEGEGDLGPPDPGKRPWVHPSELPGDREKRPDRHRRLAVPITAGLAGALAAFGLTALAWGPDGPSSRSPVATTLAAQPTVTAASDLELPPGVVRLAVWTGSSFRYASAIVYHSDGLLVTAAGLLTAATGVETVTADGDHVPARVVGTDPAFDLAVLRVDAEFPAMAFRSPDDDYGVGDACVVLGGGHERQSGPVMAQGFVAATETVAALPDGGWMVDVLEIDVDNHPSSIGGAVFDHSGTLVGIVSSMTGPATSGPLVVPTWYVRRSVTQLLTTGEVRHAWLGVAAVDTLRPSPGARVESVSTSGPAAEAGLRPEDVIVGVDGDQVNGMAALLRAVYRHSPGDTVPIEVMRDGERLELGVTLSAQPSR